VTDDGHEHRLDLARRSVGIERATGLVERGLELARAISEVALVSVAGGHAHIGDVALSDLPACVSP